MRGGKQTRAHVPTRSIASAIFTSSSGQMSGQCVKPKYSSANLPFRSVLLNGLPFWSISCQAPPMAALPTDFGDERARSSENARQLRAWRTQRWAPSRRAPCTRFCFSWLYSATMPPPVRATSARLAQDTGCAAKRLREAAGGVQGAARRRTPPTMLRGAGGCGAEHHARPCTLHQAGRSGCVACASASRTPRRSSACPRTHRLS